MLGHPLFPGETGVDQLVEIIKILGTPSQAQVDAMNPAYTEFQFPQVSQGAGGRDEPRLHGVPVPAGESRRRWTR